VRQQSFFDLRSRDVPSAHATPAAFTPEVNRRAAQRIRTLEQCLELSFVGDPTADNADDLAEPKPYPMLESEAIDIPDRSMQPL
jgi:hypothetical protein